MKIVNVFAGAALALSVAALSQPAAASSVLYDSGPIDGNTNAVEIDTGSNQAGGASFTVGHNSKVTGVTFGAWTEGGALTNVDWGITDQFGTVEDDGTAVVTEGSLLFNNVFGFDVRTDSFSTSPVQLTAGTVYYLWLQGATSATLVGWDANSGSSNSYFAQGVFDGFSGLGSVAFQILGNSVPEPATWTMMLLGVAGLGASLRMRRRTAAAIA